MDPSAFDTLARRSPRPGPAAGCCGGWWPRCRCSGCWRAGERRRRARAEHPTSGCIGVPSSATASSATEAAQPEQPEHSTTSTPEQPARQQSQQQWWRWWGRQSRTLHPDWPGLPAEQRLLRRQLLQPVCAAPRSRTCGGQCTSPAVRLPTGCCAGDGCCQPPANQCNDGGQRLCCAPNCAGRECGDDGCGNTGTCGSCCPARRAAPTASVRGRPVCSPQNCPTGCCGRTAVSTGQTEQACGTGGAPCVNCPGAASTLPERAVRLHPAVPGQGVRRRTAAAAAAAPEGECVFGPLRQRTLPVRCGLLRRRGYPGRLLQRRSWQPWALLGRDHQREVWHRRRAVPRLHERHHLLQPRLPERTQAEGSTCTGDSECCLGNCFNGVCADRVTQCGGAGCSPSAKGCAGDNCCFEEAFGCAGDGVCCDHPCCDDEICCDHDCCGEICCSPQKCINGQCCPAGHEVVHGGCFQCCTDSDCPGAMYSDCVCASGPSTEATISCAASEAASRVAATRIARSARRVRHSSVHRAVLMVPHRTRPRTTSAAAARTDAAALPDNNDICCVLCDDLGPPYICCPDLTCGKPRAAPANSRARISSVARPSAPTAAAPRRRSVRTPRWPSP